MLTVAEPSKDGPWFIRPFTATAAGLQYAYGALVSDVKSTVRLYLDLIEIKKQSAQLAADNEKLKAKLAQFQSLQKENSELRETLAFRMASPMNLIAAEILGSDALQSDHLTTTIDKGLSDGVLNGQAVIAKEGVVGYILQAFEHSSRVLLVNDRYAVVDAVVERTQARGLIEGRDRATLQLRYLERREDVEVGDLIVTSGLDDFFPRGFPVAKVTHVEKEEYGVTVDVTATPLIDSNKLNHVFVIKKVNSLPTPINTENKTK